MQFSVNLTQKQVFYAQNLLPEGYSFQMSICDTKRQRSAKKLDDSFTNDYGLSNKRTSIKNQNPPSSQKISIKEIEQSLNIDDSIQIKKASKDKSKITQNTIAGKADGSAIWRQMIDRLKSHRCSWPFRLPVDPKSQGVPNYLQIIKQPMDLRTMEHKLKIKEYKTDEQFHADINKIINNSFTFNPKESTYYALTQEFQTLYLQIKQELTQINELPSKKQSKALKQEIKGKKQPKQASIKKATLGSKLSVGQRQKLFHRIYELPQSDIIKLIKIINKDGSIKDWQELQIDFKQIDDDRFEKIVNLVKQK